MRFLKTLCATAGLLTLGATAFAQTTITLAPLIPSDQFNIYYKTGGGASTWQREVAATPIQATISGFPSFTVYCVDLENPLVTSQSVGVTGVNVPANGLRYDPTLPGTNFELTQASWLIANEHPVTLQQYAALQAAIWALIDGNTDFLVNNAADPFHIADPVTDPAKPDPTFTEQQGSFAGIVSDANQYLDDLEDQGAAGVADGVVYVVDRTITGNLGQDVLGGPGSPNPHVPVTPEGASLLLFLPGLIPVAIGLRRRRSSKLSVK